MTPNSPDQQRASIACAGLVSCIRLLGGPSLRPDSREAALQLRAIKYAEQVVEAGHKEISDRTEMEAAGVLHVAVCVAIPNRTCQELHARRHAIAVPTELRDLSHKVDHLGESLGAQVLLLDSGCAVLLLIDEADPLLKDGKEAETRGEVQDPPGGATLGARGAERSGVPGSTPAAAVARGWRPRMTPTVKRAVAAD